MLALGKARESIDNTPENLSPDGRPLILFLCDSLAVLWKDWPKNMRITGIGDGWNFSLSGTCPYEGDKSVFMIVGQPFQENVPGGAWLVVAAMRCQGCLRFIVGIVSKSGDSWEYHAHYPLGSPDDSVDVSVPEAIAADFSEALRCMSVGSPKAAVAMCRRSVQASCDALGAKGKNLKEQIDDLATKQIITDPLRRMAHKVRLTANRELHASTDDLETFGEPEAAAIIKVMREYFHHVYVMPALLDDNEPGAQAASE